MDAEGMENSCFIFSQVLKGFLIRNFFSRNRDNACHFKCFTIIPSNAFYFQMVQKLCCDFLQCKQFRTVKISNDARPKP